MPIDPETLVVVVIALAVDAIIGDPDAVWRRWPHPVVAIGRLIALLDDGLNRQTWSRARRKAAGVVAIIIVVAMAIAIGLALERALRHVPGGLVVSGILASILIAQNSLYRHVARVRAAFAEGGLPAARKAVAMIVGRNPDVLDEAAVCRAAIESCAENFADGVVAPVVWLALFGLPGLIAYKAINTADSMIGHRTLRHQDFGWAAARLDDLVNLLPARLAGLLIAIVAPLANGSITEALKVMWRDARNHRSPNAGWPESAMASALGVALAGPRTYGDVTIDDRFLNAAGRHDAAPNDIDRALRVYVGACVLQASVYAVLIVAM
ncbi:MAG: adenosylcobinamide-phosphate synthase [Tardiphaga sp.]|nr:adenosylcobinamide-phosphate synthase [Tardiphaga sp.]